MKRRPGSVLIIVVVIVVMVSLAAYHFTNSMESEHIATRNGGDQITQRHCALSGVELVASILQEPRRDHDRLIDVANRPIDLWPSESEDASPCRVTILFPGASDSVPLVSESSKLNLHQLLEWEHERPGLAREVLSRLPQMDESIADRLLDWIDADSQPRSQGDEQGARNSVPLLVDNLAFLQTEQSDDLGQQTGDRSEPYLDEPNRPAWLDYLTVHSAERNETFDGQPRVFLNEPNLISLHQKLTKSLSSSIADYIIFVRQYGVGTGARPGGSTAALNGTHPQIDLSLPATVRIDSLGQLVDSFVSLPAGASDGGTNPGSPRLVASPMTLRSGGLAQQPIDEILDRLTTTLEKRLIGRVNVLTAPPEVLSAIPGLDQSIAERIVSGRQNLDVSFRHPIGLLSSLSLDSTIVKQVLRYLTVSGDVVRAEFIGSSGEELPKQSRVDRPSYRPSYRCEAILDASGGRTKQVIFRRLKPARSPTDFDNDTRPTTPPSPSLLDSP